MLDVINGAEWGAVINGAVCEPYVFVIKTGNGARSILSPLKSLLFSSAPLLSGARTPAELLWGSPFNIAKV